MYRKQLILVGGALAVGCGLLWAGTPISSLKGKPVPQPSSTELSQYVSNKALALALGKALFWDMQVGSDGIQSCASCHFNAGADSRSFNQVSPSSASQPGTSFSLPGPNGQLTPGYFPVRTQNVVSSQGICQAQFAGITPGSAVDRSTPVADAVFNVGGRNVRRVEPRNTPTSVGAVFNHRNFWDGRAKHVFNGVSPFGDQDPAARVVSFDGSAMQAVRISISNSSLASQAVGPPTSDFEMSFAGRTFPDVGRKMLGLQPLAKQKVSMSDSVLGSYANGAGLGAWSGQKYDALIRSAFHSKWWGGSQIVVVNPDRSVAFRAARTGAANEYTQMEYNFSLFFGLAVQLYEASLIPDDTRFDRYDSKTGSLTSFELAGKHVFEGKGKCANCHGGSQFSNASVEIAANKPIERMIMGNGQPAVYDTGFYNIAVRPTAEDLGVGGVDPFGNPLSFSRLFQRGPSFPFVTGDPASLSGVLSASERVAVDGAKKTAPLRNVALTAPYFVNGGMLSLRQVVDFYNRGGDFARQNADNLDADIESLGLTDFEKESLVAFLNTLTDDRVKFNRAPFDHPSLQIPLGGAGCAVAPPSGTAEQLLALPETGAGGYSTLPSVLQPFLGVNQNDANPGQFNAANPVDLSGQYNVNAIVSDGTRPGNGGLDGKGYAFSANLLGNSMNWGGLNFIFGAANTQNGVTSKTIQVPAGLYTRLKMLGASGGGTQSNQAIVVNYADGTTSRHAQTFSDWSSANPLRLMSSSATNQGHAKSMAYRVTPTGGKDTNANLLINYNWLLFGYDIVLDSTKAVTSITLPANRNVVIVAVNLAPASPVAVSKTTPDAGAVKCANENGTCGVPFLSTVKVWYGAEGRFNQRTGITSSIGCNNSNFGDPIPGVAKACWYKTQ
ncbi:MAG: hypothetical protein IT162_13245 [Bryobacterales bacterium]|nr:hypothetical protein [Bryobacterales bacterium]